MLDKEQYKDLLMEAVKTGNTDVIDKISAMMKESDLKPSRDAFINAIFNFKAKVEIVPKSGMAEFEDESGQPYTHLYSTMEDIEKTISKPMEECGLMFSHNVAEKQNRTLMICVITHKSGYEEKCAMAIDDSGSMKVEEKLRLISLYKRYTLMSVLGLVSEDIHCEENVKPKPEKKPNQKKEPNVAFYSNYPQKMFEKNLPKWKKKINDGGISIREIEKSIEARGESFTEEQIIQLNS